MQNSMRVAAVTAVLIFAAMLVPGCRHHKDKETTETPVVIGDVPTAVVAAFEKDHAGATITKVEKETYADGTVHYEIDYTNADGKKAETEYSASGEELEKH